MTVEYDNVVPEGASGRQTTVSLCWSCTDHTVGDWLEMLGEAPHRVIYFTKQDSEMDHQIALDMSSAHDNSFHGGQGRIGVIRALHVEDNPVHTPYTRTSKDIIRMIQDMLDFRQNR